MIGRSGDSVRAKHKENGREDAQRGPEKIEPDWLPHVQHHEWKKIVSVMTSCRILSWASEYSDEPIRFVGTMNMYSKNAIPQLRMAAMYHFLSLRFFRCAYQANVMKVFEMIRSPAVRRNVEFIRLVFPFWLPPAPCR